jgi:ribosomal protein S18 acetylase RimI-like enzyme
MAVEGNDILGVCRLHINKDGTGQIRFMAVEPEQRGKGIGRRLLYKAEEKAISLNISTIILQARDNAVGFYESEGYAVVEKTFSLYGIQHYLMSKTILSL